MRNDRSDEIEKLQQEQIKKDEPWKLLFIGNTHACAIQQLNHKDTTPPLVC